MEMNAHNSLRACLLACGLVIPFHTFRHPPKQGVGVSNANLPSTEGDGQHDFDFALGRWKTHLSRIQHPLTGSKTWIEYEGSSVVHKIWNGRANLEEFEANGPAGQIEGLTLRLYNPLSHQWSQSWAASGEGILNRPMIGDFRNGRGEFFDHEPFKGRAIYVRWVWSGITPDSCRFEQSFSEDAGNTWETNFIWDLTREKD